ncbi:MAG: glutamine synthetase type III [Microcystis panniformis Mp_MB_F_20051200_S9]|uniref:Glutamine synthetase type III n=1 Tax=Microcystis panniformis Mp_MB_F_20051200_S9 TaxID=2486223 RepID=A0A552PZQ0_9CHRO|nr:MAG: glutamine synthetase type III [Microcystis panniformis Mp_GB_SS_20050300_S99D]TRV51815.1 MAG: glutamine synthetase type III [Microcystis panniformis Mp_GB_SS_20050300_S99]TRV53149.1 MAG: glutamine synthetase type III [Microcystis panniformis Mp_MB_F_20080800_S26D]TRV54917.1 MAG: glutamine synthetase type III [Microcystis panniformis Mp_MB_F_20080800_S26]TRV62445.1 MAG: glutamine synthetase type III [Microcystis panniformis Mp_MB_F_20051200_S9]TRV67124.1 MAG: glutamine synthetase type I
MSYGTRVQAISQVTDRKPLPSKIPQRLEALWATDVFTLSKMQASLPKDVFKSVKNTILTGGKLDVSIASAVAAAMKDWATSKGALYYAHVFYPMTNATAEKHDGFISVQSDGSVITEFTGKVLVQGEPDGSSFPNGGLRSTFEARGYTAWDVTSPAYVMETDNGVTLCIPTVFISWTGEALDKKTPLLRSISSMSKAATRVLKLLGHTEVAPVNSSCGAEQEYFLVDAHFAHSRPDLLLTGRTLFGKPAAKGQQFDDHYFGAIPERVQVFMQEVEERMYRLGIPAKTRHNEVAPGQFEIAPFFEAANVASDHQQLIMTLLKSTAKKHGFVCLLHEKPFAGINGSGKHVNWSVGNATQGNLLDPGDTPHANMQFLLFCGAVIRGVHKYGALLRAVVATASNDHRLGANEAPPAIISVYLGSQLEKVFDQISQGQIEGSDAPGLMDLGVDTLPVFPKDPGDRNRTSPFAFTGNRFEFRAVGSNQSVSGPLVAMNTILADSLTWVADNLESRMKAGEDLNTAVQGVLKEIMDKHRNVIFGGNGYSQEWHKMAVEERGLANLRTTADALPVLRADYIEELFTRMGVLTPVELESRFDVYAEQYLLAIEVEAKLVVSMAKTIIYPAAVRYLSELSSAISNAAAIGIEVDKESAQTVSNLIKLLMDSVSKLSAAMAKHDFDSIEEHMQYSAQTIRPLMDKVREYADTLEGEVADNFWPLPTYQEMLFVK